MLHEPTRIKESYDLRRIIEQDLGTAPRRTGRAHLWKRPFHNEQRGFSLAVWADGYRCFGACDTSGDAIDWLMNYRRLSFTEALASLDTTATITPRQPRAAQPVQAQAEPPDWDWQCQAECVVSQAEDTLWSGTGQRALTWLIEQRGLTAVTIRLARLGYVPGDAGAWRDIDTLRWPHEAVLQTLTAIKDDERMTPCGTLTADTVARRRRSSCSSPNTVRPVTKIEFCHFVFCHQRDKNPGAKP